MVFGREVNDASGTGGNDTLRFLNDNALSDSVAATTTRQWWWVSNGLGDSAQVKRIPPR
jgi:hypothetical protein